jgi:hypothetical protein
MTSMIRGHLGSFAFGAISLAAIAPAAADTLSISASDQAAGAKLNVRYADGRVSPPAATARLDGSVLIVKFDEPFDADISGLAAGAPKTIAFARRDADGQTLRISLRRALTPQVGVAGGVRVIALNAPPKPAPAPVAKKPDDPGAAIDVGVAPLTLSDTAANDVLLTVGQRPEFTRLSFLFPRGATIVPLQTADKVLLKFSRPGEVDISDLRIVPPKYLKDAVKLSKPGQPLVLQLTVDPGVKQRHFIEGGRVIVDLMPPEVKKAPPASCVWPKKKAPTPLRSRCDGPRRRARRRFGAARRSGCCSTPPPNSTSRASRWSARATPTCKSSTAKMSSACASPRRRKCRSPPRPTARPGPSFCRSARRRSTP